MSEDPSPSPFTSHEADAGVKGRFWAKVLIPETEVDIVEVQQLTPDGAEVRVIVAKGSCWTWQAGKRKGYGTFWLDGQMRQAHEVAWTWEHGPTKEGMVLDHLCRNHACVRPLHLEEKTIPQNVGEGIQGGVKGRSEGNPQGLTRWQRWNLETHSLVLEWEKRHPTKEVVQSYEQYWDRRKAPPKVGDAVWEDCRTALCQNSPLLRILMPGGWKTFDIVAGELYPHSHHWIASRLYPIDEQ